MDKLLLPHRRYNPLVDRWVLVSPQRTKRPWQGGQEALQTTHTESYDATCYLCPGNVRANGQKNPDYKETYVFPNDFPALLDDIFLLESNESNLMRAETVKGVCRVVCFSPRHDLTLTNLNQIEIEGVIRTWIKQVTELKKNYAWVQIFENRGAIMGASNPHPHGQIWASNFIPNEIVTEDTSQKKYYKQNNSPLLIDYMNQELQKQTRIVVENDDWVFLVPFWAVWPYETLLLPKKHLPDITTLASKTVVTLSHIMKKLLGAYDRLFETSMPYSMGWHCVPFNNHPNKHWQLHAHYYPPLLRSATVKKFMVGYEMLAEVQRDITAEEAAAQFKKVLEK